MRLGKQRLLAAPRIERGRGCRRRVVLYMYTLYNSLKLADMVRAVAIGGVVYMGGHNRGVVVAHCITRPAFVSAGNCVSMRTYVGPT